MENNSLIDTSKQAFRIQVPWVIRFALIWTIFFAIVGIFIQFSKSTAGFVWTNFFNSNYLEWFSSFGHFTNPTYYPDLRSVVFSILGSWYYFFYTGGLLALIWELLSLLIHAEFSVKKRTIIVPSEESEKSFTQESLVQGSSKHLFSHKIEKEEIQEWLDEAWVLLSEEKIREARAIYKQIKRYYQPSKDLDRVLYTSIINLYKAILESQ